MQDACPCNMPGYNAYSNKRWCCGDTDHFDMVRSFTLPPSAIAKSKDLHGLPSSDASACLMHAHAFWTCILDPSVAVLP